MDRSAAYAARYIAKNMVAAGVAREMLVQVSYAIGVARPLSIFVNTYGTAANGLTDAEIAVKINEIFDLMWKSGVQILLMLAALALCAFAAWLRNRNQERITTGD